MSLWVSVVFGNQEVDGWRLGLVLFERLSRVGRLVYKMHCVGLG